jgi:MFS family permease
MAEKTASRYRFVIGAVLFPLQVGMALLMGISGPLMPLLMDEFRISSGTASWFGVTPQILSVLFSVPAGLLANRIGLKKTLTIGYFLLAAGLAAPLCVTYPQLLITRVLFGVGIATAFPLAGGIIAHWFPPREIPLANGFNMASGSIGQTLSFFITVPIVALLSWRSAMVSYSILVLLLAFGWLILGREKPALPVFTAAGQPARPSGAITTENPARLSSWQVLRRRETLLLAVGLMGAFGLYLSFFSWLPTYYNKVFQMPLETASAVSAIFLLAGIPGSLIGGILPARLGFRKPIIVISGLMLGVLSVACYYFNNPFIIFPALALYGFFGVVYMPSVFTIPMELGGMTPRSGAIALSLALSAGNLGGFICPVMVGYLADFTGSYLPGFLICSVLSLSLLIGGLLLPETGPRGKKSQEKGTAE